MSKKRCWRLIHPLNKDGIQSELKEALRSLNTKQAHRLVTSNAQESYLLHLLTCGTLSCFTLRAFSYLHNFQLGQ